LSSAFLDNVSSFHYPNKQLKKVGIFHTVYLTGICSRRKGDVLNQRVLAAIPPELCKKAVLMKILIPILPKNYYSFTLIRGMRKGKKAPSAMDHRCAIRWRGAPCGHESGTGRGTRQKNLSHPEKGSKMMIRNQWAEGKECAAGKFKNSWFT